MACFLQVKDRATAKISPVTYNANESFKQTQTKKFSCVLKSRKETDLDRIIKRAKDIPGVGAYDQASIAKGYAKLSSSGRKRF